MRKDIDPLPPIIMINVNDVDYKKSIDDIGHRLLIHGKYYSLVQVTYRGPSHFHGVTVTVLNGCYLMYDEIRAFGKERNRVKYMGGKTQFYTRGNNYYVINLWYKK